MLGVYVIPMLSDNFSYYVYKMENLQQGFFVDVSEPHKVKKFMETYQIQSLTHILTTHKHMDHSGGNVPLSKEWEGLQIIGGANDGIPGCT